jgi:hypothetical protein
MLETRGRGGFGTVDIAWDTRLRRRVAIKRIPLAVDAADLPGITEARTAALLGDTHIVAVHDFEVTGTEALIIMENVDGPTLYELMAASDELLDIDTCTTILDGIAQALETAHENQVLHLDIKPSNVLIDHGGRVKVSDFGLAELSGTAGFNEPEGGTIGYMPPEQLAQTGVDARTDLWAFAALAYQLLCGSNPFYATTQAESLDHIENAEITLPSIARATAAMQSQQTDAQMLDPHVDAVIIRALQVEMDARPDSVKDFWDGLMPWLGSEKKGRRKLKALVADTDTGAALQQAPWQQAALQQAALQQAAGQQAAGQPAVEPNAGAWLGQPAAAQARGFQQNVVNAFGANTDDAYIYGSDNDDAYDAAYAYDEGYEEDDDAGYADGYASEYDGENGTGKRQRSHRTPGPPLWERASERARGIVGRLVAAVGCGTFAWVALIGLANWGSIVGAAASAASSLANTSMLSQNTFATIVQIVLALIIAVAGFLAPSLGAALAAVALSINTCMLVHPIAGLITFVIAAAWWVFSGRLDICDATSYAYTGASCGTMSIFAPSLFQGYFLPLKRAVITSVASRLSAYMLMAIMLLNNVGALPIQTGPDVSFENGSVIVAMFTDPTVWCVAAAWLASTFIMRAFSRNGSVALCVTGAIICAAVQAATVVVFPICVMHADAYSMVMLAPGIALACAIMIVISIIGVRPYNGLSSEG